MRQFELRKSCRGRDIAALVLQHPDGSVHVSLCGGGLPHIGAAFLLFGKANAGHLGAFFK